MARALVTAQVQSVKEINKKAEIKKWNKKITTIVLIVLILSICAILFIISFKEKLSKNKI
jgi:heme/copper-type cytochrome/quinol oxidase subunit 2